MNAATTKFVKIASMVAFGFCLSPSHACAAEGWTPAQAGNAYTVNWPGPRVLYHHASTLEQGTLDGIANLLAAQGENEVSQAQAAGLTQQAKHQAVLAAEAKKEAFWRNRQAYAERMYGKRPRSVESQSSLSNANLPARLPATAITPLAIHWPEPLRGESFASDRVILERALAARAGGDYGPGSSAYATAASARDRILTTLRGQIRELAPMQYMDAKKFLESLTYECLFPPQPLVAQGK